MPGTYSHLETPLTEDYPRRLSRRFHGLWSAVAATILLASCSAATLDADKSQLADLVADTSLPMSIQVTPCEGIPLFDLPPGVVSYVASCLKGNSGSSATESMELLASAISQEVGTRPSEWSCDPLSELASVCHTVMAWPDNSRNDIRINALVEGLHDDPPPPDVEGIVHFAVVVVPHE